MYGNASSPANAFGSQAAEAWALGFTGSMRSIVGVIDTGIDHTHADLYLNIRLNQNEIAAALRAALVDIGFAVLANLPSGFPAADIVVT